MTIRTFTAKYAGTCSNCGADIEAGDEIGYVDDEINCESCCEGADL
jgi:DNA-directed RNA polymerase subunit RPC12/RpoP